MKVFEPVEIKGNFEPRISCKGLCERCGKEHGMAVGYAAEHARRLLATLDEKKRIDFLVPDEEAAPRFSTEYLFGNARGQMFGVLVCRDKDGRTGVLKAFSGQYNGVWRVPGWVPPLVDVDAFKRMSFGVERFIKRLGREIDKLPKGSSDRASLIEKRKAVSQALMKDIHALYRIPNFRRELKPLPEVVTGTGGIPTGTGDCCAPKLLGYAARHSLKPLGLVEFFYGRENKSKSKKHGGMYMSCKDKCGRILGYMLCGAGKK
ncbi:hypothetical protein [uncultured Pseudodesulfovibrio sp.]|uniref:hypothetical protein n=1 Tax=uncultured Pseudodesulfovibrio sp. TaxID=2035858 RepID=UPI0029C7DE3C|nr:hypothetical protein [uncultured Pseudodesulfovibrio sp.]